MLFISNPDTDTPQKRIIKKEKIKTNPEKQQKKINSFTRIQC